MFSRFSNIFSFVLINFMIVTSLRLFTRAPSTYSRSIKSSSLLAVKNMRVEEFGKILSDASTRNSYQIIDVREPDELQVVSIKGEDIINLPLSNASKWSSDIEAGKILDATKPTLCLCHHGARSMRMANYLENTGFVDIYNIEGGIHMYAVKVDPSIGVY